MISGIDKNENDPLKRLVKEKANSMRPAFPTQADRRTPRDSEIWKELFGNENRE